MESLLLEWHQAPCLYICLSHCCWCHQAPCLFVWVCGITQCDISCHVCLYVCLSWVCGVAQWDISCHVCLYVCLSAWSHSVWRQLPCLSVDMYVCLSVWSHSVWHQLPCLKPKMFLCRVAGQQAFISICVGHTTEQRWFPHVAHSLLSGGGSGGLWLDQWVQRHSSYIKCVTNIVASLLKEQVFSRHVLTRR